jgi:ABC-type multidrug transport system fused ATPase/permease subunit
MADKILICVAWFMGIVVAISNQSNNILVGNSIDDFTVGGKFACCDENITEHYDAGLCALTFATMTEQETKMLTQMGPEEINKLVTEKMTENTTLFIMLAIIVWFGAYVQTTSLMITAERQITKLRPAYFRAMLRQDIGYYDTHDAGELNSRLFDDIQKIRNGIGEKVGIAIQSFMQFSGGLTIAFIYGWKMTLVLFGLFPFFILCGWLLFVAGSSFIKGQLEDYAKAAGVAEEVISGIRTVTAFSGQKEGVTIFFSRLLFNVPPTGFFWCVVWKCGHMWLIL